MNFRSIGVLAAMAASVGAAGAADLYVKAPVMTAYDWSGIYVGANAGYGWADTTWTNLGAFFPDNTHPKGALAGGQIGINRQFGNWVWGTELTGDWAGLSASDPLLGDGDSFSLTTKLHDLETLTGRLGYAFNNVLVYAKSGGATGVVSTDFAIGGVFAGGQRQRLFGTTAGAGIEYGLTPNWILGVEYDYTRLFAGQFNIPTVATFGASDAFTVQSVLGRVSYKF